MTTVAMLSILALLFFAAHVLLLFTSFGKSYRKTKYLWSHIILWICGAIVYLVTVLYAGKGVSTAVDVFDTPGKRALIPLVTVALSLIAHTIVKLLVLPRYAAR